MDRINWQNFLFYRRFTDFDSSLEKEIQKITRSGHLEASEMVASSILNSKPQVYPRLGGLSDITRNSVTIQSGLDEAQLQLGLVIAWLKEAFEFSELLESMPEPDLIRLYQTEKANEHTEKLTKEEDADRRTFINYPSTLADYEHWGKVPGWTPMEAAALILGKDPRTVNDSTLRKMLGPRYLDRSPFAAKFRHLVQVLSRAQQMTLLATPIPSQPLERWLRDNGIETSEEFNSWFESHKITSSVHPANEGDAGSVSAGTWHRLIVGLAACHYGFELRSGAKSNVAQDIANDLEDAGISIDVKTVRKALNAASSAMTKTEVNVKQPSHYKDRRGRR